MQASRDVGGGQCAQGRRSWRGQHAWRLTLPKPCASISFLTDLKVLSICNNQLLYVNEVIAECCTQLEEVCVCVCVRVRVHESQIITQRGAVADVSRLFWKALTQPCKRLGAH